MSLIFQIKCNYAKLKRSNLIVCSKSNEYFSSIIVYYFRLAKSCYAKICFLHWVGPCLKKSRKNCPLILFLCDILIKLPTSQHNNLSFILNTVGTVNKNIFYKYQLLFMNSRHMVTYKQKIVAQIQQFSFAEKGFMGKNTYLDTRPLSLMYSKSTL